MRRPRVTAITARAAHLSEVLRLAAQSLRQRRIAPRERLLGTVLNYPFRRPR
jgi:hypothetical protein